MKTLGIAALSASAGLLFGAVFVQGLHAQAKPPGIAVVDNDVSDMEAYNKEFSPLGGKALADAGAKFLVRGGRTVSIEGDPPKGRAVVLMFESVEKAQAAFATETYKEARKIGDKYAKFRIYIAEGIAQ